MATPATPAEAMDNPKVIKRNMLRIYPYQGCSHRVLPGGLNPLPSIGVMEKPVEEADGDNRHGKPDERSLRDGHLTDKDRRSRVGRLQNPGVGPPEIGHDVFDHNGHTERCHHGGHDHVFRLLNGPDHQLVDDGPRQEERALRAEAGKGWGRAWLHKKPVRDKGPEDGEDSVGDIEDLHRPPGKAKAHAQEGIDASEQYSADDRFNDVG